MQQFIIVPNDNVYFYDAAIGTIAIIALYDSVFVKPSGETIHRSVYTDENGERQIARRVRSMTFKELDSLCEEVRQSTGVESFDWNSSSGQTVLKVSKDDIQQASVVIQAILEKGFRIYMNDKSQLTISLEDVGGHYNQDSRERALLEMYRRLVRNSQGHWDALKCTIDYQWTRTERVKLPELKAWVIEMFPENNQ